MAIDADFLSNARVLVVDDHMLMRSIINQHLRTLGFKNIDSAQNGSDAWEMIKSKQDSGIPYNIIFLDWHMPVMDGLSVLKNCRADKKYDSMAIIMITAEQEQTNVLHAIENGATSYIIKPVAMESLKKNIEKISEWLQAKGSRIAKPPAEKQEDNKKSEIIEGLSNKLRPVISKGIENIFSSLFNVQIVPENVVEQNMQGSMICVGKMHQKDICIFLRFFFDQELLKPLLMQIYSPKFLENPAVYQDAACEIVNILCSQVKAFLNEHGYDLTLDFPETYTEKRMKSRSDTLLNVRFSINEKKYFLVDVASGS